MMYNVFFNPTPRQFFYLIIAYVIIVSILGYFLAGGLATTIAILGSLQLISVSYSLQKYEKIHNKEQTLKQWWICFAMPLSIALYFLLYGGILSRSELITDKNQLSQATGVIPKTSTPTSYGSGKSRRNYDFLVINNTEFNCADNDHDICKNIYPYKGKTATLYYYPKRNHGNLVYEIIVDNQVIYDFDKQLQSFQDNRKKENSQIIWVMILYLFPAFYIVFIFLKLVNSLEEELEQTEQTENIEPTETQQIKPKKALQDYLWIGIFLIPLFIFLFLIGFGFFIAGFSGNHISLEKLLFGFILMALTLKLLTYFGSNKG